MKTFHEEIMNIIGVCDDTYQHCADLYSYFTEKYNKIPDAILFLWTFNESIFNQIKTQIPHTKIILWTDDLHWYSKDVYHKNYFSYTNADILLGHYNYFKIFYNIDVNNKLIRLYHSCGTHFLKEQINNESKNKIYFYGACSRVPYHLRSWFIDRMTKEYPELIVIEKHPGYGLDTENNHKKTAEKLYNYSFSFTAGAFPKFEIEEKYDTPYYIIGKFFEIPGSGALLICNDYGVREELNTLGFYDMVNYVNITDDNFTDKIKWLIDENNQDKIMKMRINGHELVKTKHSVINRIKQINDNICYHLNDANY